MPSPNIVSLSRVTKVYRLGGNLIYALREVSLEIPQGASMAITGPSGSGKSTLMNLMGCLDVATSGEVMFEGRNVNGLSDGDLAKIRGEEIGFVFQTFNLIPRITTLENVLLPMSYTNKISSAQRRARAQELLGRVGLGERLRHTPAQLSGGERQRVAVARALANDPVMILADEPTGNLDSDSGREIMEIFKDLNEEGRTVVVVTHNPMVASYAEQSVKLSDGRVAG